MFFGRALVNSSILRSIVRAPYVVLFGDSTLDNGSYVRGRGPSVIEHLKGMLHEKYGKEAGAKLMAVDGSVVSDIPVQARRVDPHTKQMTTHVVVSIGGNNGLAKLSSHFYGSKDPTDPAVMKKHIEEFAANFAPEYENMIREVKNSFPNIPLILCAVFKPNFPEKTVQYIAEIGLKSLNGIIKDCARRNGARMIDLESLLDSPHDYANAIEPGVQGGRKIAETIVQQLQK